MGECGSANSEVPELMSLLYELSRTVRIVALSDESTETLSNHSDYVYHVSTSRDSEIISCGEDHTVAYWDGEPGRPRLQHCDHHADRCVCTRQSPIPAEAYTSLPKRLVLCVPAEWRYRFGRK
jgi:WD40 repeat protein